MDWEGIRQRRKFLAVGQSMHGYILTYSSLRTFDSSGFSTEGTIVSVSAVPHCWDPHPLCLQVPHCWGPHPWCLQSPTAGIPIHRVCSPPLLESSPIVSAVPHCWILILCVCSAPLLGSLSGGPDIQSCFTAKLEQIILLPARTEPRTPKTVANKCYDM